ncbi:MAG: peptidoglycan bridge formation glycyltransferase FemA/FemB family protein [Spirochaetia bacterium]|jgi:lipid II:glycine glycyltransferase (peptidoglycan interpeptide bridge formation enzyme)|nr:peptidoglycan bridge formation glycyltransferase FemA/FemB family protein [Spirochaetia bacterium]
MDVRIKPKTISELESTRLVQQTNLWARVKSRLGWTTKAFDIATHDNDTGDLLLILRDIGYGASIAYVPFGPEFLPPDLSPGEFLSALSQELKPYLPAGCIMTRWDLPWESPYAQERDRYDEDGHWLGAPDTRVCEARMNFGIRGNRLRKSPSDILPPDTLLIDLRGSPDDLLSKMRPKTRYNVRLARRHGVQVRQGCSDDLAAWNTLYSDTSKRNGFSSHGDGYFASVVANLHGSDEAMEGSNDESITMLIAEKDDTPLAAMFLSISADRATYLYGASSSKDRQLMAPYALQWAAMEKAKASECSSYDLFGVAPRPDHEHPMYGLYAFKSGFGGTMLHRQGSWDFAYDESRYFSYVASESACPGFLA